MASPPSSPADVWTTRRLLDWMTDAFRKQSLDSPRLLAELLLAHVVGCERLALYTQADRPASPMERETLRTLVGRALKHEPVQYLVGEAWFFSLPLKSDRRALIPRPSTETLVEHALQHARLHHATDTKGAGMLLADVCTGSGAIAIAMLKRLPEARCVATDISQDALDLARDNAQRHGVLDRLELLRGDLLTPLREHPVASRGVQYLLSNPPYIPDDEWAEVEPNVRDFEPELALRGGADGMRFVTPILEGAPELLRPGGMALVEIAASRADESLAIVARDARVHEARIEKDFEGLPRAVVFERRR